MKEDKNESRWDKLLNIRTMGRDDTHADQYRYPYEPTPYSVLERLANAGYIRKGNILLDYGCGKGRVDFFLSYQTRCKSIGIEYDERIYEKAAENKKYAVSSGRVEIELANAEEFAVSETADRMYFFNPFSVEILRKVMATVTAGLDVKKAKIKETDDEIRITIPHCTINEDSIKIKSSDLKIYDTNFAIMSIDKEAVIEVVAEAEEKAKKKAESDEYGFLDNADENAKKVIKGMFENVAGERKVVVEFK